MLLAGALVGVRPSVFRKAVWLETSNYIVCKLVHIVHHDIGRVLFKTLGLETVRDAAGFHHRVARRANIYAAVSHHDGPLARDSALFQQLLNADRIRLLLLETVAAINLKEMATQSEPLHDRATEPHRLMGEHGHSGAAFEQSVKTLLHTRIEPRVVEHMIAIVTQEEFHSTLNLCFARVRS